MDQPPLPWSRDEYERAHRTRLTPRAGWKPITWRIETPVGPCIVKDSRRLPWWRRIVARAMVRRERTILRHLAGLSNVSQLGVEIDADAFGCPLLPGRPLSAFYRPGGIRHVADQVLERIDGLAEHGIHHLDLHHKRNILVTDAGEVFLVDFASAVRLPRWLRGTLGRWLRWVDRHAALKYLARWKPSVITEAEAREFLRFRAVRFYRQWKSSVAREETRAVRRRLTSGRDA